MLKSLSGWFGRERKDSATGTVMALHVAGKAVWTPRTYERMTREGFGKNAVAYRCIRMVAEACASIPLRVEFEGGRAPEHPLQRLIDRPNGEQGGEALREAVYGGLMTSGNAYVEAAVFDDMPAELWSLRPDRMKVVPNRRGWPEAYEYAAGGAKVMIGRDETGWLKVLHVKLWHPYDDWYGFSPLEAAAAAVDVHNASGAWNKALLDNAARPSGALVYGSKVSERLSEDQFNRLREQLSQTYAGSDNAGRPLLLEGGLDWKPMGLTPAEMDFSEGRYAAARDIALAFGVPGQLLGIPGDNSYANYREANAAFWRNTVLPLAGKVTRSLSAWLGERFVGTRIVCDVEGVAGFSGRARCAVGQAGGGDLPDRGGAAASGGPQRGAGMSEVWQMVPIGVVVTLVVQTGFVLVWVGRAAARLDMMESRLDSQAGVAERLARLEEQAVAQRASLDRIENKLAGR